MPSRQSEAVRRHWRAARLAMVQPDVERPDDESWGDLTAEPREVDYIETDAGGLPAMWAAPKRSAEDRALLCMHGGGFIGGSIYSHRKLAGHLAKATGARALVFDYHLAPEYTHPSQVDEATAVYRWLLDQGVSADHIAFTGDSSGGGLSITTQLRARERGLPLPAAAMPFSPWVDMEVIGASYDTNRDREPFFYAVKSALQRARSRLDQVAPERERVSEPTEPHARALLDQYIAGFENADAAALERALRTDAAIEMAGTRTWFSGRVTCLRYLMHVIGSQGDWRMIPTLANGQPAAAAYHRDSHGIHRAFGLGVLTVTDTGIARILVFGGGPDLVAKFGLPPVHLGAQAPPSTRR